MMDGSYDGWHWISTVNMTCAVRVEGLRVVEAPPILGRFIGQPARNLAWLRKQPGFEWARI